jgi:5,10-methylene-tetrahydrofolate dehydrogenase/methenyl tetrahydrofolate cyclohydrolase
MYVRFKRKACEEVGIATFDTVLPADVSEADLVKVVRGLNENPAVNGILVQLPLPKHINEENVLSAIGLDKDVDGFHPLNIGKLCMKGRSPLFEPCTPKGCVELLDRHGIPIAGKNAVVIGRSNIVGLPVANLLLKRDATVTVCHSKTADIPSIVRNADIVVAAIGLPEFVKADWIKPGAVVIDVGINSIADATKKAGKRTVGDVEGALMATGVASYVTPVPGGVGPMTIAMLLRNTTDGWKRALDARQ